MSKLITGSFLRITQVCKKCGKSRVWNSQPYVGGTPAGNLFMSASILYSGSLPTKVLRVFSILKCAAISEATYFRHQKHYLLHSVRSVYNSHKISLISAAKGRGPLALAGDGRADSPGHSAKYGTYTVIDLKTNKVVAFSLVQVCSMITIHIYMHIVFCFMFRVMK